MEDAVGLGSGFVDVGAGGRIDGDRDRGDGPLRIGGVREVHDGGLRGQDVIDEGRLVERLAVQDRAAEGAIIGLDDEGAVIAVIGDDIEGGVAVADGDGFAFVLGIVIA